MNNQSSKRAAAAKLTLNAANEGKILRDAFAMAPANDIEVKSFPRKSPRLNIKNKI